MMFAYLKYIYSLFVVLRSFSEGVTTCNAVFAVLYRILQILLNQHPGVQQNHITYSCFICIYNDEF